MAITTQQPTEITPLLILLFGLLHLLISIMQLSPTSIKHCWGKFYAYGAVGLGALAAISYFLLIPEGAPSFAHTAREYISFIALIGALFVVAGG